MQEKGFRGVLSNQMVRFLRKKRLLISSQFRRKFCNETLNPTSGKFGSGFALQTAESHNPNPMDVHSTDRPMALPRASSHNPHNALILLRPRYVPNLSLVHR